MPHACTNLRRLDAGLCGLQVYLRAHGALWTNSKAWCRAMLALVLGDWGAQVRFLTLLAGMLPSSEGRELDSLGDEEVFLATYLERCYNVGSLCTSQTSTACSSSAFGRMLQVEVSPPPPLENSRLVQKLAQVWLLLLLLLLLLQGCIWSKHCSAASNQCAQGLIVGSWPSVSCGHHPCARHHASSDTMLPSRLQPSPGPDTSTVRALLPQHASTGSERPPACSLTPGPCSWSWCSRCCWHARSRLLQRPHAALQRPRKRRAALGRRCWMCCGSALPAGRLSCLIPASTRPSASSSGLTC